MIIEALILLKNISIGKGTLIFQQRTSVGNSSTLFIECSKKLRKMLENWYKIKCCWLTDWNRPKNIIFIPIMNIRLHLKGQWSKTCKIILFWWLGLKKPIKDALDLRYPFHSHNFWFWIEFGLLSKEYFKLLESVFISLSLCASVIVVWIKRWKL